MRISFAIGIALLVSGQLFAESTQKLPTERKNEVGRFQLFQGAGTSESKVTFKIDTVTGKTWRYLEHADTEPILGWVPINDFVVNKPGVVNENTHYERNVKD